VASLLLRSGRFRFLVGRMEPGGERARLSSAYRDGATEGGAEDALSFDQEENDLVQHAKKRYALLFGYSGIGFHGLQVQPDVETVESTLERAISSLGVVKETNIGDLKKSSWNRAARTDKGVHAFGQVISLRMGLKPEPELIEKFRRKLNQALPKDMHVFKVHRTSKNFDSKRKCSGRLYEYLIPTFLFTPPKKNEETQFEKVKPEELNISKEESEFIIENAPPFTEEVRGCLDATLKLFEGTHAFHNFTQKIAGDDPSANRYIISCRTDPPFVQDGIEVVRVNIEGQSFMLHQIRKMIFVAIEVVRRKLDAEQIFRELFDREKAFGVFLAPGEGLALRACLYKEYNEKISGQYDPIEFDTPDTIDEVEHFRREVIYNIMMKQEKERHVFTSWLKVLDTWEFPPPEKGHAPRHQDYALMKNEKLERFLESKSERRSIPPAKRLQAEIDDFVHGKKRIRAEK